jgi:hypothetical protein
LQFNSNPNYTGIAKASSASKFKLDPARSSSVPLRKNWKERVTSPAKAAAPKRDLEKRGSWDRINVAKNPFAAEYSKEADCSSLDNDISTKQLFKYDPAAEEAGTLNEF